ncbi:12928_t:CDS:2, partial [Funneliformis geosporum]
MGLNSEFNIGTPLTRHDRSGLDFLKQAQFNTSLYSFLSEKKDEKLDKEKCSSVLSVIFDEIPRNEISMSFSYLKAQKLPEKLEFCDSHPLLMGSARAGEGKFRIAQELPKLLIECTNDDVDLQNRLKSALNDFKNQYEVTPEKVLRHIARHRNQEFDDLKVIIILDGLQVAMNDSDDDKNKESFFYNCICLLGILSLFGPFIFVTCCTATISMLIHNFLASSQKRVFLPVTLLKPLKINNNPVFIDNSVMKMLINNMGGWLSKTIYLKPVLRIILSRTQVDKNQDISTFEGKGLKIDDITQFGLIRFESQIRNRTEDSSIPP